MTLVHVHQAESWFSSMQALLQKDYNAPLEPHRILSYLSYNQYLRETQIVHERYVPETKIHLRALGFQNSQYFVVYFHAPRFLCPQCRLFLFRSCSGRISSWIYPVLHSVSSLMDIQIALWVHTRDKIWCLDIPILTAYTILRSASQVERPTAWSCIPSSFVQHILRLGWFRGQ